MRKSDRAFTLTEMLIAVTVLTLLIVLFAQLFNSASTITSLGTKRIDADSSARPLLDRMGVDFSQMVKRSDVSYFVKTQANLQMGNDQIAFYSAVTGYYPSPSKQSPVSLVAYRVNSDSTSPSYNKLERMGKGLIWSGASPTYIPILFLAPAGTPTTTIDNIWPAATNSSTSDSDYELVGPNVFRFEYYYLLTTGALSPGPWTSTNAVAVKDVAAIVVAIAAMDPKSKVLVTNSQIAAIAGSLSDYTASMGPGQLLAEWQTALDGITGIPRQVVSNTRLYERYFYLSPTQ
ncbi:MAG TPA: prepilin-type N-terminal cleavage/methylation domain-containing protein [Chthoniobacterales bacterium]|nr:prepilin-type N-terminal cleavage/methylation domain-containing protein [Chthoniobacterales bacterium]